MARPRATLAPADLLRPLVDGEGRIAVRVTPGARGETLDVSDGQVLVKVRARPEDGQANAAVRRLLAAALELPQTRLMLVRGATSREKQFRILS